MFRDAKRTAAIICTGESAGKLDREPLRRFARFCVNDGYILEPDADVLYAADPRWWHWHAGAVDVTFKGRKFCCEEQTAKRFGLEYVKVDRRGGLSLEPGVVRAGVTAGNSGAQAMNLAVLLGARRLVLVGMDMGGTHFFGEHPKEIRSSTDFKAMVRTMSEMAADLYRHGIEVVNCSAPGAIAYWPGGQPIPED